MLRFCTLAHSQHDIFTFVHMQKEWVPSTPLVLGALGTSAITALWGFYCWFVVASVTATDYGTVGYPSPMYGRSMGMWPFGRGFGFGGLRNGFLGQSNPYAAGVTGNPYTGVTGVPPVTAAGMVPAADPYMASAVTGVMPPAAAVTSPVLGASVMGGVPGVTTATDLQDVEASGFFDGMGRTGG